MSTQEEEYKKRGIVITKKEEDGITADKNPAMSQFICDTRPETEPNRRPIPPKYLTKAQPPAPAAHREISRSGEKVKILGKDLRVRFFVGRLTRAARHSARWQNKFSFNSHELNYIYGRI